MEQRDLRIDLALSGGGFRATLFHLGLIRFLYEAKLLHAVKNISAVSGGSVLAAHLVLNWKKYTGSSADFDDAARELIRFTQADVRGRVVRRWLLGWLTIVPRIFFPRKWRWTLTSLLTKQYESLYRHANLKQLRVAEGPQVTINATILNTGEAWSFNNNGVTWHLHSGEPKHFASDDTSIALAVAASSAFPPLFPPVEVNHETFNLSVAELDHRLCLSDGGVYDNLGLHALVSKSQAGLLIVSDAEGMFDWEFDEDYGSLISRNVRASDLLMARVSQFQLGGLGSRDPQSVRVCIKGSVPEISRSTMAVNSQRTLATVRTDLDRFSDLEITALIEHGFNKALHEIGALHPTTVQHLLSSGAQPWDPLGASQRLLQRGTSEKLRKSSVRKRRLWSVNDPVSWVTAAYVGFLGFIGPGQLVVSQWQTAVRAAQVEALSTQAFARISRTEARANEGGLTGWQLFGVGDCPAADYSSTAGVLPDNGKCTDRQRTAVCWDGARLTNASQYSGGPWCTYKSVAPEQCVGGSAPGRVYKCLPGSEGPAVTSFQVCIGEFQNRCPAGAIFLGCGMSVQDWARPRCPGGVVETRLSTTGGNRCGYAVIQVSCNTGPRIKLSNAGERTVDGP